MASAPAYDTVEEVGTLGKDEHLRDEKTPQNEKNAYLDSEKSWHVDNEDEVLLVNGEPVVTTGADVSRFLVDVRDDEDPAITFRSLFIGTVIAGLGAAMNQIYTFKPADVLISSVFLLLLIFCIGNAWATFLPRRTWVEGTRLAALGPLIHFINPGPLGLKEHVISALLASTAAGGSSAVQNFAVQRLFYDTKVEATTAVLATFSTACFGYGLVGLLRPITVYPSETVFWGNLPTVAVFQALHFDVGTNSKRIKMFWTAFTGMFVYEVIPAYMFPLLNGVSVFCLASQHASKKTRTVFTNVFGGAGGNEGLGILSLSFDWQYITSMYSSLPLVFQVNAWIGFGICYVAILAIYYSNTWNSRAFPMLSTSLFAQNGSIYKQAAVFGPTHILNQTVLDQVGLPALTGSNAWYSLTSNLAIGGLIAHTILFWGRDALDSFKFAQDRTQPDPHYQAMKKYKEAPWWWYAILLVLAFFAGLIVVIKGQTTLPWWSYIVALVLGTLIAPFSTLLFGRMGIGIGTTQLMKMVGGAINPGRPVANLYFSMWSHDVILNCVSLSSDLKMGQYLKIPPRAMYITQVWGTIVGVIVSYGVMVTVVDAQREILLKPVGTNVWSGAGVQALNSGAITWALAKDLYGPSGPYFIIPMSLLIGMVPTTIQWFIAKRYPKIGSIKVESINLPMILMFSSWLKSGVTSTTTSKIITGLVSQVWLRRYHPGWYRKYNYILGGAFDGGAQVMIFILSFAVFGASGKEKPFPSWAGNPAKGNVDYCNPK